LNLLKLLIIALVAGNLLLLGLEASKPTASDNTSAAAAESQASQLPEIRLLSELDGMDSHQLSRQCFTVGPFESRPTVDAIVEMLDGFASNVSPRETEAFVDRGYWVYLPPYPDEQGGRQAVKILYDAGYDDVFVVNNGDWDHAVSLGYFIAQSNAIAHRDRISELGFEAEMRIQRDDESRFWVEYEQQAGDEYASRVLAELVPAELHRSIACGEEPVLDNIDANAP